MWRDTGATLILSLILPMVAQGARHTPPGKPNVTICRSPEKETFTCRWETGYDGGLPTTYSFFYRKENSETLYECPDYKSSGNNSCFFNKDHTSVWVNYNITVVATNALGSNSSDPFVVDVAYIVEPHTPENLTVVVLKKKDVPFLRVSWKPPRNTDTRLGWITLIYEIRVKLNDTPKWEVHQAQQQKIFNIFSLHSGGYYMVQVRCKPDHGFWSEWSPTSYAKVPDYIHQKWSIWVLMAVVSVIIFLVLIWVISTNRNSIKLYLLPPVPGPKIKGFDEQLLKNGKSEEVINALVVTSFPPHSMENKDLLVEYLEVYVCEELTLERKDHHCIDYLKTTSPFDSDSGRGSCDSHTLLMEKCGGIDAKEETSYKDPELQPAQAGNWESPEIKDSRLDSLDSSNRLVKTSTLVSSSLIHGSSDNQHHPSSEVPRQYTVPNNLLPISPSHPNPEYMDGLGVWNQFDLGQSLSARALPDDFNVPSLGRQSEAMGLVLPHSRCMEYVEVQKVNKENQLILKPLSSHTQDTCQAPLVKAGEYYSKVNGVDKDNVLLLQRQRELAEVSQSCDHQVKEGDLEQKNLEPQQSKMDTKRPDATQVQESMCPTTSGYVDTAMMQTF
ncbi:hypothetical protein DPEC_G00332470 [Dallia pectoralis]|uniref:Uncharacterized protein n=1 Tax=Dallia pectoralis TaxID=75939 RepID=A0ACC2F689_DALPE|nr:hypothetical protein DPEC_G00332470 [Dallia pectoralis]